MPLRRLRAGRSIAAAALLCLTTTAFADFIPTSGTADYNTASNWTGSAINGRFTSVLSGPLTVTFAADRIQAAPEAGLLFDFPPGPAGFPLTMQSVDATPHLLTLNGDVTTGTATTGKVIAIGTAANPLNLDLGGAGRNFTVNTGDSLTVNGAINGAGFGITKSGAGTLFLAGNSTGASGFGGTVTAVTINAGTVSTGAVANNAGVNNPTALGPAPGSSINNLIINGGATFQYTGPNASFETNRGIGIGPGNATIEVTSPTTTLTLPVTIADAGVSAGRLIKTGPGTLQVNGGPAPNSYTGGVSVMAGTFGFASDARFGPVPAAATPGFLVVNAGATLMCTTTSSVTLNATRGVAIGPTSGSGNMFVSVPTAAAVLEIGGIMTNNGGTGGITMNGPGILRLSGGASDTGANTFSGGITINAGTVRMRSVGVAGTSPGGTGNGLVTLAGTGATLEAAVSGSRTYTADIAVVADSNLQSGRNGAGAGVTATFGALTIGSNTLTINPGFNTNVDTNYGVTIGGATTLTGNPTFLVNNNGAGIGTFRFNAPISGNFGITKSGVGPMILAAANTYTGPTTVTAGTLTVASGGSIASSSTYIVGTSSTTPATLDASAAGGLTVAAGKTLSGSGTVLGPTTIAGTIAPGNSIGTLSVAGMSWQPGGTYLVEHNPATSGTPGTTNDLINGTGALDMSLLGSSSQFNLTLVPVGAIPPTPTQQTYVIATFAGGMGVADNTNVSSLFHFLGDFTTTPIATVINAGGTAQSLQLQFTPTPVPEPGSIVLACGGAALAAWRKRRSKCDRGTAA